MGKKTAARQHKIGETTSERLDEELNEDSETENYDAEPIDATFQFCDPAEEDYHSVRSLLVSGRKFPSSVNISSLADVICNQGNIGGTIKSDDTESNVFGFLTILNIKQYYEGLKGVCDFIMEKARLRADAAGLNLLESLMKDAGITGSIYGSNCGSYSGSDSSSKYSSSRSPIKLTRSENVAPKTIIGLVINERFINLALELIPTLHTEVIVEDVQWSITSPEMDERERPFYFFTHLISVSTFYKQSKKSFDNVTPVNHEDTTHGGSVYSHFEDEYYNKRSIMSFSWPTGQNAKFDSSVDKLTNYKTNTGRTKKQRKSANGSCGNNGDGEALEEHRLVYVIPFPEAISVARSLKKLQNPQCR